MLSFTKKEQELLRKLNTPAKIQDFLNRLPFNFEKSGETIKSPIRVIRERNAHCMEGGLLGAFLLSSHGIESYILCLKAKKGDFDHIITPFRLKGLWGALSKTNHGVLRYREPIYRDVRELVMSYFHEYFLNNGLKTLRKYSELFNLKKLNKDWFLEEEDLWYIDKSLDKIKYYEILPKGYIPKLRKADKVEIQAGKIVEYKK